MGEERGGGGGEGEERREEMGGGVPLHLPSRNMHCASLNFVHA